MLPHAVLPHAVLPHAVLVGRLPPRFHLALFIMRGLQTVPSFFSHLQVPPVGGSSCGSGACAASGPTWGVRLQTQVADVVSLWLGSLIVAHPLPPMELRWEAWLRSPLFCGGLDASVLESRLAAYASGEEGDMLGGPSARKVPYALFGLVVGRLWVSPNLLCGPNLFC